MNRFWIPFVLTAMGCASGPTREEHDLLRRKLDRLEKGAAATNSKQTLLYEDLVNKITSMEKKVSGIDASAKILEATFRRVEEKLRNTRTDVGNGGKPDIVKPTDVAGTVRAVLVDLRSGKSTVAQAVARIHPIAKEAAPLLVGQLKGALSDMAYRYRIEEVLGNLPVAAARAPVAKLLAEPGVVRHSAARIIKNLRDRETSRELEPYSNSPDEDFLLLVGEALLACRNPAGASVLVRCLSAKEYGNRVLAVNLLRGYNGNDDFGYRAVGDVKDNVEALRKWETWAKTKGPKLFP